MSFSHLLPLATAAARRAGDILRADFERPDGARGRGDKADADVEAERAITAILRAAHPDFGFLGEETGRMEGRAGNPVWVVDPNDGTRDYLKGRRGSAVSIGLVFEGRPVLGVVHPFAYPDSAGTLYVAAEGLDGVLADGAPSTAEWKDRLDEDDVVLVSGGGDRAPSANLTCTKPARFRAIPSIAHRLALVASGRATGATSLYSPKSWDFAAGHMLMRAAGGTLIDEHGIEPHYDNLGLGRASKLFASSKPIASLLAKRDWSSALHGSRDPDIEVVRVGRGKSVNDAVLLGRVHGSFLGALTAGGDMSGRIGIEGEWMLSVSRALLSGNGDVEALKTAHAAFLVSDPTAQGVRSAALASGVPIAIWGLRMESRELMSLTRAEASLRSTDEGAHEAACGYVLLLRSTLRGLSSEAAIEDALTEARRCGFSLETIECFLQSSSSEHESHPARRALRRVVEAVRTDVAFARISEDSGGVRPTMSLAPTGAIVGARWGRESVPYAARSAVLSHRALRGFVTGDRPSRYWAIDALDVAECLAGGEK